MVCTELKKSKHLVNNVTGVNVTLCYIAKKDCIILLLFIGKSRIKPIYNFFTDFMIPRIKTTKMNVSKDIFHKEYINRKGSISAPSIMLYFAWIPPNLNGRFFTLLLPNVFSNKTLNFSSIGFHTENFEKSLQALLMTLKLSKSVLSTSYFGSILIIS